MKMKRGVVWLLAFIMVFSCLMQFSVPEARALGKGLRWPVPGHYHVTRDFTPQYGGIDIADNNIKGAAVVAAMDGYIFDVVKCPQHFGRYCSRCQGDGTSVVIKGDDKHYYFYSHLQQDSIPYRIYPGAHVKAGTLIGNVGATGDTLDDHLFFEISRELGKKSRLDPAQEDYQDFMLSWSEPFEQISQGNATVQQTVRFMVPSHVDKVKMVIQAFGKDEMLRTKTVNINRDGLTALQMQFDVQRDFGFAMKPGVRYHYRFDVYFNGTKESEMRTRELVYREPGTHEFGNWKVISSATCASEGLEKRVCKHCGLEETRIIPVSDNHVYSSDQDRDCNLCGQIRQVSSQVLDVYRLYNKASGEHLYCTDPKEINLLASKGWTVEGISWRSPAASGTKVYRLYNPYDGSHLYTLDQHEINRCLSYGWQMDGAVCYSASRSNGLPIYRLYNPNAASHYHLYTISDAEIQFLKDHGWQREGIAWYAVR